MSAPLDAMRAKVREGAATPKKRKKEWSPPDPTRFRHGYVLSFDQTLTHTGWAAVISGADGIWLGATGSFPLTSEKTGFEGTYDKAERLYQSLCRVMIGFSMSAEAIVTEMPAVQGYRTESSLMAGREVRRAAAEYARGVPVVTVANQTMRALLNPPEQRYEKHHVKSAVEALIPEVARTGRPITRWNQNVHDAVGLALTYLYEKESAR